MRSAPRGYACTLLLLYARARRGNGVESVGKSERGTTDYYSPFRSLVRSFVFRFFPITFKNVPTFPAVVPSVHGGSSVAIVSHGFRAYPRRRYAHSRRPSIFRGGNFGCPPLARSPRTDHKRAAYITRTRHDPPRETLTKSLSLTLSLSPRVRVHTLEGSMTSTLAYFNDKLHAAFRGDDARRTPRATSKFRIAAVTYCRARTRHRFPPTRVSPRDA